MRTREYILKYLDTWATKGVYGHFKELNDSFTSPWLNLDDDAKKSMGKILGALPDEVAIMETLTANLHLLMASFYKPTKERYKIIIEGKAFPSDHVGRIDSSGPVFAMLTCQSVCHLIAACAPQFTSVCSDHHRAPE